MTRRGMAFALVVAMLRPVAAAQAYAPIVTMVVTMPDGRTQELTAAESGLATLTLKDGTEYGFRPTIQDSAPWNRIVVTIFRSATTSAPTAVLGEIEVRRGGPALDSKTNPSFKVSVPNVSAPTSQTDNVREPGPTLLRTRLRQPPTDSSTTSSTDSIYRPNSRG